jgi:hypothetical protein
MLSGMPAQVRVESQKWLADKQRVEVVIAFGEDFCPGASSTMPVRAATIIWAGLRSSPDVQSSHMQ